ncbi:hypothetical protein D3C83_153840 [compost metagenome]
MNSTLSISRTSTPLSAIHARSEVASQRPCLRSGKEKRGARIDRLLPPGSRSRYGAATEKDSSPRSLSEVSSKFSRM